MTLGSLFDGSGGFPLAGIYAGLTPLWASEVEPYPIAVTRHRLPGMKHLGDVSKVSGADVAPVDVITFGSPCQDMSIAGKRAGMQHSAKGDEETTRSGMFYEAIRIIKEMRAATNGEYPKYAVWENVPGAFSSSNGEDFRCVLEEFVSVASGEAVSIPLPEKSKWLPAGEIVGDGFSVAWRVLDAQYWGVPQRRKRIYLVADLTGERAGKILFERDGLSGNPQPGGAERQGTADDAAGSTGGSDRVECLNPWDVQSIRQYAVNGVWPALSANNGGGQNRSGVCYALDSMSSNSMKSSNPHSGFHEESVTKTLQAGGVDPTCNQGGNVIVESVASFMGGQGSKAGGIGYSEQIAPTIKSVPSGGNTVPDVVYALQGNGIDRAETAGCNGKGWRENECYTLNTIDRPAVVYDARGNGNGETVPTLTGDHQNRVPDYTAICVEGDGMARASIDFGVSPTLKARHTNTICTSSVTPPRRYIVRRLTPLECCRLQGFPDGWADIDRKDDFTDEELDFWRNVRNTHATINGKQTKEYTKAQMLKWYNGLQTDSAIYRMWGNGIALPCARFVLEGIAEMLNAEGGLEQ